MSLLFVFIYTLCLGVGAQVHLNYTVVRKLANSCPHLDSCGYRRATGSRELHSIKEKNCECDYLCHEYGDCCIDAPGLKTREVSSLHNCYEMKQFGGVYMVDTCLFDYEGPDDVRYQCESTEPEDFSDPLGAMPVTDSVTGITYKNYYCSICNYKTDNIVLWTPRLECPTVTLFDSSRNITQDYVFNNIASSGTSWGIHLAGENGSLFFHDCEIDPVMPTLLESKIRLCKPDLVSDCPTSWENDDIRTLCLSYMGARYIHGGDRYRNAHCAICNGMNATHLSCKSPELREMPFFRQFETHAFSLLLDINEERGREVGTVTMCENGEIFDPFFKVCRSLACLPGYMRRRNECVPRGFPVEESTIPSNSGDGPLLSGNPELIEINSNEIHLHEMVKYLPVSETEENETVDLNKLAGTSYNLTNLEVQSPLKEEINKLQNCLLISLEAEDFVLMPNKSIYVPKYNKTYDPTSYHATDGSVLVCSHLDLESDLKFMPTMGYVTTGGIIVSMICLIMHIIVFSIVPDLQNLSGKNLFSQCVSLICAYSCFLTGSFDTLGFEACTVVAFMTFYFFQVSFFWMALMAYDVWRTLKLATTELRVAKGRQLKRFCCYSFIAWIAPLLIITTAAFAEFTDIFPVLYRPGFASPRCWFKRRRALLVFFVLPLLTIMIVNIILFLSSARMLVMATQSKLKQQNQSQKRSFKLYLRLAVLMGLTWITGFIASYTEYEPLWYLFVILNTLQGLFIFIAFSCTSKVYNYFKERSLKPEFKNTSHSASTGSTHTTVTTPSLTKKFSSRFFQRSKSSSLNSSGRKGQPA